MATLIITLLFGLFIAYFATQNTATLSLHFLNYTFDGVPVYMLVIGALLVGLLLAWIISMVNTIGVSFAMRGKENKIRDYKKENAELIKQNHQLELENTKLKAENHLTEDDKSM